MVSGVVFSWRIHYSRRCTSEIFISPPKRWNTDNLHVHCQSSKLLIMATAIAFVFLTTQLLALGLLYADRGGKLETL